MEQARIKKILFFLLMAAMWLPLLNTVLRFQRDKPLGGVYTPPLKPTFSFSGWRAGTFQEDAEKYLNDTLGFHRSMVRFNNQIQYSIFCENDSSRAIGKDGYLFESDYFKPFLGLDFIGEDSIRKLVTQTKLVQDSLAAKGVTLLWVLCPSKARVRADMLPEHVSRAPKVPCNMELFLREFKTQGIHHMDLNSWFISLDGHTPYKLYPSTGIHWSAYGASLALDTILGRMEQMSGKDLPEMVIDRIETPDTLRSPDNDIALAMNLIWEPEFLPMAYPIVKRPGPDSTKWKPRVLTVGDSYYWNLFGPGLTGYFFSRDQFWFYNRWGYDGTREYNVDDVFFKDEIESQDFLLLFYTESQLSRYTTEFIPRAYRVYTDPGYAKSDLPISEEEIREMMHNIEETPDWKATIEDKARKEGRKYEEQLRADAIFVIKQNRVSGK